MENMHGHATKSHFHVMHRVHSFEELYNDSYNLVYSYVRMRMADADAAEDVVAEAYLLAARSFNNFDPSRAKFSTWVTAIAKNCIANYYRKARPTSAIDSVPEEIAAVDGGQSAVDDHELVHQLMRVLTDEERELVLLKYREGYRNIEIAEELGMNASTVSTKLANALAKMRAIGV